PMYTKKTLFIVYVKGQCTVYPFMIILFLTGIVFGAMIVNSMNFIKKQDLFFYLERFFGEINDQYEIAKADILKNSFLYHAKYLFIIIILGLSVVGLPISSILLLLQRV